MRLGSYPCVIKEGTVTKKVYGVQLKLQRKT